MGCLQAKEKSFKTNVYKMKDCVKCEFFMIDSNNEYLEGLELKKLQLRQKKAKTCGLCSKKADKLTLNSLNNSSKTGYLTSESILLNTSSKTSEASLSSTSVDDKELLDCSQFWRICGISVHSDDYISGITIQYCLPGGQLFTRVHTLTSSLTKKSKSGNFEDLSVGKFKNETLLLEYHEFLTKIVIKSDHQGITSITFGTNLKRTVSVNGRKDTDECEELCLDLSKENRVLTGFQTMYSCNLTGIYCYTSKITISKMEDLEQEQNSSVETLPSSSDSIRRPTKVVPRQNKKSVLLKTKNLHEKETVVKQDLNRMNLAC
ncbi:unnamed protein product [Moneuplotes crassus]|uniref:Jacalin-type lectin domain-containing protein n=1 Tax=Euplotes crassus TaxID=5936 RepID=A0AAD1UU07_EUPCR|nr:unnamed protein product [Moneuplotes crassus]